MIVGLAFLIVGAELLVRGASRLAVALGLSPLVIGLTIVAIGTSAPELAVSVASALRGHPELSLTNVVGSNIFNILGILGIAASVAPLLIAHDVIRRDVPIMLVVSVTVFLLALDHRISHAEGALLCVALLTYTAWRVTAGGHPPHQQRGFDAPPKSFATSLGLVLVGLLALVLGSSWLVDGAIALALWLGVSEIVVGLTIVAAGTSLPELATSVLAAVRGERDIAVGNVVGSNIFNLLGVLGLSAALAPSGLVVPDGVLALDLPVMVVAAFACLPLFASGRRLARGEGVLLLGYYVAYVAYLILRATQHQALRGFEPAVAVFVLALTVVMIAAMTWRTMAQARAARSEVDR